MCYNFVNVTHFCNRARGENYNKDCTILRRHIALLLLPLFILFFVVACARRGGEPTSIPEGTYPIDPLFQPLYGRLGGDQVLGPGISPIFENGGILYQYVDRGLLMYDAKLPRDQRFRLAPLGYDLGVYELPDGETQDDGGYSIDGYAIFDTFVPLYESLGGKEVVGKPLTQVHKNIEKNRYEQYFENLGFYWIEGDTPNAVGLLSYGAWKCDHYCRHAPPENSYIQMPSQTTSVFINKAAQLGLDYTGYARTETYLDQGGQLEQIYDNIVMAVKLDSPDQVFLLPIAEILGLSSAVLLPPPPDTDMYFYPVKDGLGYNVPAYFMEYIQAHEGIEFNGAPVTQLSQISEQSSRQCFRNICLDASMMQNGSYDVQPVPLGLKYRDAFYEVKATEIVDNQPMDIAIQIWEEYPLVSPDQEQVIGVLIYGDNLPLSGVEPELELSIVDHISEYKLPPSGEDGKTEMRIEPLHVRNGTLIPYKVCVTTASAQKFCVLDSFLVWITDTVGAALTPPEYTQYLPFIVKNADIYFSALLDSFVTYLPMINNSE